MWNIQYTKRTDLDVDKWNACIDRASNGLIYAYSYYLDAMCDNWDALVLNDYEAVMPLPWRKKWSFYYLYQPLLVAQLGLFGQSITKELLTLFLHAIPKKFSYLDYTLNFGNRYALPEFRVRERQNITLNLHEDYNTLYERYQQNTKRNIKKAVRSGCSVKKGVDVKEIIRLAKQQGYLKGSEEEFNCFEELYLLLAKKDSALTYGVLSPADEIISAAVFFFSHNRAYYILVGNHPHGRVSGSSHMLIDAFMKEHCKKPLLLDFEGSDIPSVAQFYFSFAATPEYYVAISENRLPWYIKWLKK